MPDQFGFDHISDRRRGETLRCIWCPTILPMWTDEARLERHAARHAEERRKALEDQRREKAISEVEA